MLVPVGGKLRLAVGEADVVDRPLLVVDGRRRPEAVQYGLVGGAPDVRQEALL